MRENISSGKGMAIAERRAPRGCVVVEVVDAQGTTLALDTFEAAPATRSPLELCGIPCTRVVFADDTAQQEVTLSMEHASELPFNLPEYLLKHSGAFLRLWWSCDA